MINDFLKKYQEELISERIQIKEDIDLLDTKIKEESKFLTLLEESNEVYFQEFTPRDINAENNKKAEEIRLVLNDLYSQLDVKNQQLKFYDSRLVEINALLTNTVVVNRPNEDDSVKVNESNISAPLNNDSIKNILNNIKDYVVLDPYKAKLDLEKLISTL